MANLVKSSMPPEPSENCASISEQNTSVLTNNLTISKDLILTSIFQFKQDIPQVSFQLHQVSPSSKNQSSKDIVNQNNGMSILCQILQSKLFKKKYIEQQSQISLFKKDNYGDIYNISNIDPSFNKNKKFSQEEDEMLKRAVFNLGAKNWRIIASFIPGRTPRQCRDRYSNYLAPEFVHTEWKIEEDNLLAEKFMLYGPKWTYLKQFFPQRTANDIKNRFNYTVSRIKMLNNQENQNNLIDNQINDAENVQDDVYLEDDQNQLCFYNEDLNIGEYDFRHMNEHFDNYNFD